VRKALPSVYRPGPPSWQRRRGPCGGSGFAANDRAHEVNRRRLVHEVADGLTIDQRAPAHVAILCTRSRGYSLQQRPHDIPQQRRKQDQGEQQDPQSQTARQFIDHLIPQSHTSLIVIAARSSSAPRPVQRTRLGDHFTANAVIGFMFLAAS